ncbi:hypothetical protein Dimus_010562 [Dionaea muscipula]
MGRAPCCDKTKVKRGPWSPEEDETLKNYVEKYGTGGNWIALPQKAGLRRCGKSCRLRWLNYLRPHIKRGSFTDEEDNIIISLYDKIGSRWSVIASNLPGRTDNDVKNHWNTKLKKKLFGGGGGCTSKSPSILPTSNYHHHNMILPKTNNIEQTIDISPPNINIANLDDLHGPASSPSVTSTHGNYNLPIDHDQLIYSPSFTTLLSTMPAQTTFLPSLGYDHGANSPFTANGLQTYYIQNEFLPHPTTNSSSSLDDSRAILRSPSSSISIDHCKNSYLPYSPGMEDADVLLADFGFGSYDCYGNGSIGFCGQQKGFDGGYGNQHDDHHVAQGLCHTSSTFTDLH